MMDEKERARALEQTLGQIEKQFGKGSILRLGAKDAIVPVSVISTGSIALDAALVVVSYNNEAWITIEEMEAACAQRGGAVRVLAFDSRRYVGALIGIHDPNGKKVGRVSHVRNIEYVMLAGAPELVEGLCKSPAMSLS